MLMFGLDAVAEGYDTTCDQLKTYDGSIPGIFHFVATPPASSTGLRFSVELTPGAPGPLEWSVYVRAGRHVDFGPGDPMPVVTDYDHAVLGITTSSAELLIDGTTEPPFDPTTTYHLALTHRNCPGVVAKVSVEALAGEEVPDAGDPVDGDVDASDAAVLTAESASDAGGCGCRVTRAREGREGWSPLVWAAAALAVSLATRRGRDTRKRNS
jgi:hypothetical protein